jgi:hypothetical protein
MDRALLLSMTNLMRQAIEEKSHHYVGSVLARAMQEIIQQDIQIKNLLEKLEEEG